MALIIEGELVKSALARAILGVFKGARIYKERQVQNFIRPCFFIAELKASDTKKLGSSKHREYSMVVRYIPEKDNQNNYRDCNAIGSALSEVTEIICCSNEDGDKCYLRGKNIRYTVEDDTLNVFCEYGINMKKVEDPNAKMMALEVENIT